MNALLLSLSMIVPMQAGEVSPVHPQQGETITLRCTPDAASLGSEPIFATLKIMAPSGADHRTIALEDVTGKPLEGTTVLPNDAQYFTVRFATKNGDDAAPRVQSMVFGSDMEPVQGARVHRAAGAQCLDVLAEELEEYPESYAAYRKKWFYKDLVYGELETEDEMNADLETIGDADSAEALFARSYIHLLRGEEALSRAAVLRALSVAPTAAATSRAIGDYEYNSQNSAGTSEVRRALYRSMSEHPASHVSKDQIYSHWYALEFDVVRDICAAWKQSDPLDPLPDAILAASCNQHGLALEEGARAAAQALNSFLDGTAELANLDHVGVRRVYVPWCAIVAAEIAEARGDVASAIAYAKVYQDLAPDRAAFGLDMEANLWDQLGDRTRATERLVDALRSGSTKAQESLRQLWLKDHDNDAGFESHLSAALQSKRAPNERLPAPAFDCTDMSGHSVSLDALHGRVVVLNFWSLGCMPCKREIPSLNELVGNYEDKPVTFLAFAPNEAADVARYTEKHPFSYGLVAAASEVSAAFDVTSLPTHVVIDPAGRVVAQLTGAGEGQPARIAALIDLALREA